MTLDPRIEHTIGFVKCVRQASQIVLQVGLKFELAKELQLKIDPLKPGLCGKLDIVSRPRIMVIELTFLETCQ